MAFPCAALSFFRKWNYRVNYFGEQDVQEIKEKRGKGVSKYQLCCGIS